jgi:hypothetical protein
MEITTDTLPWDSDDVIAWQNFLQTQTGRRLIPKILESTPELANSGDVNAILIRSGEVRGFQAVAQSLLMLAMPPKEPPTDSATNYPSLVDDRQWADGQKIQP